MDATDRHLLRFVLSWAPYGNPPADQAFCEFGMTLQVLLERFETLAAEIPIDILDRSDYALIMRSRHLIRTSTTYPLQRRKHP